MELVSLFIIILFSLQATVLCDIVTMYILKKGKLYKEKKYLFVEEADIERVRNQKENEIQRKRKVIWYCVIRLGLLILELVIVQHLVFMY